MRNSEIVRKTNETDITVKLLVDGNGRSDINTGCGFFDHMLTLFSRHGGFDLDVFCEGDIYVDYHHSVEDVGIALGKAFAQACGDFRGISRYADIILPMDEALMLCAMDISGRSFLSLKLDMKAERVGDFDTQLVQEFFLAFVRQFPCTLHIKQLDGENTHHIIEAVFKSFGRVLGSALAVEEKHKNEIPSTKGVLV